MINKRDLYLVKVSIRNEMERLAKSFVKEVHNYDYDEMHLSIECLADFYHCLKEFALLESSIKVSK